jgi:hypothetical protein
LTFGEIEGDSGSGGWFTAARKPPSQSLDSAKQVREADFGGASSWFTPPRQAREQPGPSHPGGLPEAFRDAKHHDQGFDGRDPRGRGPADGGPWREIPARGVTAANRWAEVTRGGTPAGVNPSRGQRGGGFGEAVPEDIPFRGARVIDVSASRYPPARRGPAYSAYSAAASGPPGTARRRQETGALRKIRESGAIRAIMDTGAMRTLMDTTAMQVLRERYAGKGKLIAIVGVCCWVVLAVAAISLRVLHGG